MPTFPGMDWHLLARHPVRLNHDVEDNLQTQGGILQRRLELETLLKQLVIGPVG